MRKSETMRAASRLLLSHPIVCLLAALAAVMVLGVLGPIKVVHAADVAVEGENFANKPPGATVVNDTLFSGGRALKFTADGTASHTDTVICSTVCDVVLMARAGHSGGTPSFSVNNSTPQAITTSNQVAPAPYTFDVNLPAGSNTIRVTAGGTGTGHNAFLDVAKIPADGGSGGTLTDTDGDGVPDSTDQCDTQSGAASNNGCPLPTPDLSLTYISSATGDTGTTPRVKVSVPVPQGTKQGDFMLALLQADYGNVGGTLPSGWKLIDEHLEGRDLSLHAYYKIAAATEPPSYTWNVVNAGLHPLGGGTILSFRGVDKASPVFANAVNPETADPAKIDCPSVNAPNGAIVVCGFTHDDPQPDIKAPAGMTRVSNFIIRNDDAHAVAYEPIAKGGATGVRSATINPNIKGGKNDISMAISLRPSAVNSLTPAPKKPKPPNKKTAPRVLSTFPKANAKAVAPRASLKATLSKKMRASSINTKTFKLFKKKGSTKKLSARVTYNAATKKATLNPTTSLRKGLSYKAVLSPGAKDVAGNRLDQKRTANGLQQKVWSFTVRK